MTIQDRKQTTTAELIAEARRVADAAARRATGNAPLYRPLADALEAAEKRAEENRKEIDRLSRELQVAEDQANTIAGDLAQAERERDNWKLSAEEAERAEKRWKDRAIEAERELQVAEDQANNLAGDLAQAEKERDEARKAAEDHVLDADAVHVRLSAELRAAEQQKCNALCRDVEQERDALAAVVEQVRLYCENQGDKFRHHAGRILDMLAASPADALREHDAKVRAEAQEATIQADADTLAAEIHEAWEFQYDECDHGTYSGGHLNGEPYAMCRLSAERIVRRRAADRIEKEAGL